MKSNGVESWLSPWLAMWNLLLRVERCLLSRLAKEWWSRTVSVAGSGAKSWPLLRPVAWSLLWREVAIHLKGARMLLAGRLPSGALSVSTIGGGHLL